MTDREEFAQLRSDVIQLTNDVRRLQQNRDIHEQQLAQLHRALRGQGSWAIKVTKWIQQHTGGHLTEANDEIESWTKEL